VSNSISDKRELTTRDKLLVNLGIRPREAPLVGLLFSNMFLSGIAIGMIRVCAFTLFLEYFASEQLALTAIGIAIIGTLVTLVIDRTTRDFAADRYIYTVLATILIGLIATWALLGVVPGKAIIFALPLFFEVIYMLFSLQFIALLTRLLNVRQTKRLSGITRSGEFLAEMVGGLSIVLLLNFMEVKDLLLVASVAVVGVFLVVRRTVKSFNRHLTTVDVNSESEDQGRMLSMLSMRYVRLIGLCYGAFIFAYFFLDVAFYKYAVEVYPNEVDLASFIGQFFAISGFLTLLTMVFIFAPFLRSFGVLAGVVAFPLLVGLGSAAVSVLEFSGFGIGVIFIVMVATNALRVILQSAIWRPTVGILFQVLPDRQRSLGASLIEGIIDPLASGLAGIVLYIISEYFHWPPEVFLALLAALMGFWILCGFLIRRNYLTSLVASIQTRKLGRLDINQLDSASLKIILRGLDSPYPAEVFYCLDILEEIEHPDITNYMQYILASKNEVVRMDILRRLERLKLKKLAPQITLRIHNEFNPNVLGQVLRTYAALDQDDTVETLRPFLDHEHSEVRKGALVGILNYSPTMDSSLDYLLQAIRSEKSSDRVFAAEVLGAVASRGYSGYLTELLDDTDPQVVDRAIIASGEIKDERLVAKLLDKLNDPAHLGRAGTALQQHGTAALLDLERTLSNPTISRVVRRKIIEILQEIQSTDTTNVLLQHIDIQDHELRHHVYVALANVHYQASDDDRYKFVNTLNKEVESVTFLLASMEDIWGVEELEMTHAAMGHELDLHRDNILLLMSFIFSSSVMLDTRANIDSKVSDLRVFALEVLDNLLTAEVKQIVFPLLDDLTVAERLQALSVRFPQAKLSANDRLDLILSDYYENSLYWTKAVLLHKIGELKLTQFEDTLRGSLNDQEALVRETALWALAQLEPEDLSRTLAAHADDESPNIRTIVAELLTNFAEPST
jgi:AAA family ATP:ADP antiporter